GAVGSAVDPRSRRPDSAAARPRAGRARTADGARRAPAARYGRTRLIMSGTSLYTPSRSDMYALLFFMLGGAIIAVGAVVQAVMRMGELAQNNDVRLLARFVDTNAEAPIGPSAASVPVELESAWVTVPSLPADAQGAAIIQEVVFVLTVVTIVTCLV